MSTTSLAHRRAAALTAVDRGISLVARIAGQRANSFSHGAIGRPLPAYMILIEREARVRRIVRVIVEQAFGCSSAWDAPVPQFVADSEQHAARAERAADARREGM